MVYVARGADTLGQTPPTSLADAGPPEGDLADAVRLVGSAKPLKTFTRRPDRVHGEKAKKNKRKGKEAGRGGEARKKGWLAAGEGCVFVGGGDQTKAVAECPEQVHE